jgi:hypothetical protein
VRTFAHIRPRWWLLVGAWLTLGAWGPVEEGTEASIEASGGEYEFETCGTTDRYRQGGGRAAVNYRPRGTDYYLGAEAQAVAEVKVATRQTGGSPDRMQSRSTKTYFLGPHLGWQSSLAGAEIGVSKTNSTVFTPGKIVPHATFRFRPEPRYSVEIDVYHQNTMNPAQLGSVAVVYAGPQWRITSAADVALSPGWRNEVEYHLGKGNWLGVGATYRGLEIMGLAGAAVVRYRWTNSEPMPEHWSEVKNRDYLLRKSRRYLDGKDPVEPPPPAAPDTAPESREKPTPTAPCDEPCGTEP